MTLRELRHSLDWSCASALGRGNHAIWQTKQAWGSSRLAVAPRVQKLKTSERDRHGTCYTLKLTVMAAVERANPN